MFGMVKGLGFGTKDVVHAEAPASRWYGDSSNPHSDPSLR